MNKAQQRARAWMVSRRSDSASFQVSLCRKTTCDVCSSCSFVRTISLNGSWLPVAVVSTTGVPLRQDVMGALAAGSCGGERGACGARAGKHAK